MLKITLLELSLLDLGLLVEFIISMESKSEGSSFTALPLWTFLDPPKLGLDLGGLLIMLKLLDVLLDTLLISHWLRDEDDFDLWWLAPTVTLVLEQINVSLQSS